MLAKSPQELPARVLVSDATSVVVMLEGRTGDPVSTKQRDATARVLADLSGAGPAIPLYTSRIIGLDTTRASSVAAGENPGDSFSYLDLIGAAGTMVRAGSGVFRAAEPPTAQAVNAAATQLAAQLQISRSEGGVTSLAVLSAYENAAGIRRSQSLIQFDRRSHAAAAQQETSARIATEQTANATATQTASANSQPVPTMDRSKLIGVLFDFTTGLWTDQKAVGKLEA